MGHYIYRSHLNINPQRFITRLVRTPLAVPGEQPLVFGSAQNSRGLPVIVRFALSTARQQEEVRGCEPQAACGKMAMRLRLVGPTNPLDPTGDTQGKEHHNAKSISA